MITKIRISLLSLLLLLSCLLWLVATTAGARLLLSSASLIMPGTCHLTVKQGNLLQGLVIDKLRMRNRWVDVDVARMILRWSLSKNSLAHFDVTHATLTQIVLAKPEKPPFLIMPFLQIHAEGKHTNVIWHGLQLPLDKYFSIQSPDMHARLIGNWLHFNMEGTLNLAGSFIPPAIWHVQGSGSVLGFQQVIATSNLLQGQVMMHGQIHWIPPITWQGELNGTTLHWQHYRPAINAITDLTVSSRGYFALHEPLQLHVNLDKLTGELSGYPLLGHGNFAILDQQYLFQDISLQSHKALLQLQGQYGKKTDLNWQISIPNLTQILAHSVGSVQSQGQLSYDNQINSLQGQANALISHACYQDLCLNNATLNALFNNNRQSRINFNLVSLKKQNTIWINQGSILFQGERNSGSLKSIFQFNKQKFETTMDGNIYNKQLKLNISALSLIGGKINTHVNHTIHAVINSQQLQIQPFCFQFDKGTLCLDNFFINRSIDNQLSGTMKASSDSLRWLSDLSPQLKDLDGKLNLDLSISGEKNKPVFDGNVSLSQGQFSLPIYGLAIKPINGMLSIHHNQFHYQVDLNSTPGQLSLKGKGQIEPLNADIDIHGSNLSVMNNADAKIQASPDLKIHMRDNHMDIKGSITIPQAEITPKDYTSTTRLPNDIVWVDDESQDTHFWHLTQKIEIILGKAIHVHYAGLDANLNGHITINQNDTGAQTAVGAIKIPQGKFTAYGQDLTIKDGALTYTGGALNNPGLSITATRKIQNFSNNARLNNNSAILSAAQTVGIRITGTLDSPKIDLYSEPPGLSQADIFSYLVLGRSSAEATSSQSGLLMNALSFLNIGGSQAGQLSTQLSKAFGLDELSVGSQQEYSSGDNKVVDNTSVIIGKTFASRLYVNYSIGLLEPINVLQISYKLTHRFELQSEHSTNGNGVDLFYTWAK